MPHTKNLLTINALELDVFLGWPNEERLRKQTIKLDVNLQFKQMPHACISDDLAGTVCYRELIESLRRHLVDKKFHLIEHLTHEVYQFIRSFVPVETDIAIALTKRPQILGLGSVTYHYGSLS